ncbi:biopolymer transporter ExbD [Chitinispirillales bacterium ANBcel5]|uniref:biopolymer transporter ExbD n=1 Tax=Cellulosispirillum alkaliphilum TaxID=3039283 RepID=UPI002A538E07|nr:biopolymer transporter ExbD [Chitinispirillales bacterium ANBcel5]
MGKHGRFNKPKDEASFNITSLLDVLVILLLFLLQNFSAEGALLTNADNLVLPNSESKLRPEEVNLQMAVTPDMVLVDNQPVVPVDDIRRIPQEESDPVIEQLEERLNALRAAEEDLVRLGALNAFQGSIVVQIDKNVEFDVLFKIMHTCGGVGYNDMKFAVMEREE